MASSPVTVRRVPVGPGHASRDARAEATPGFRSAFGPGGSRRATASTYATRSRRDRRVSDYGVLHHALPRRTAAPCRGARCTAAPETFTHQGAGGYWRLKVADFAVGADGRPALSNVRSFEPAGEGALRKPRVLARRRTQTPVQQQLLKPRSCSSSTPMNIYSLELATGHVVKLTQDGYNEHA